MTETLHTPDPDQYRVKVGRYGDRWYHDPLPADDRWPATDEQWPSVTTVKKADGKDWSWVSLGRAAEYLATRRHELDGMNAAEIHARLLEANKAGLNRAGQRGTAIHGIIEAIATGQTFATELVPDAEPYLPACHAFLDDHQPEWVASEVVAISRDDPILKIGGWGGTLDAFLRINGKLYIVDWKTRGAGKHGAYMEEGMQIAAYAYSDYVIVGDSTGSRRLDVHCIDGGLIVSLTPEGYRLYPVDLEESWCAWMTLRGWFDDKQRKMIGKPVILCTPREPAYLSARGVVGGTEPAETIIRRDRDDAADPDLIAHYTSIYGRIVAAGRDITEEWLIECPGIPGPKRVAEWTADQLAKARVVLDRNDPSLEVPPDIPLETTPEREPDVAPVEHKVPLVPHPEGPTVDPDTMATLQEAVGRLTPEQKAALGSLTSAAVHAGVDFRPSVNPSLRRFELGRAAIAVAEVLEADEDITWAAIQRAVGAIGAYSQPATLGAAIGCLTPEEAHRLERTVRDIGTGRLVVDVTLAGVTLVAA